MNDQVNDAYKELLTWFSDSPIWVQVAAKKLLTEGKPFGSEDIARLANICLKEARKEKIEYEQVIIEDLAAKQDFESFSIASIGGVTGVDAIEQTEPLLFSEEGLVAIFGSNGSGKSGYARMLKRA